MTKVIMSLGYNEYIIDLADAVTVMEALTKAENYKSRYAKNGDYTYHVWTDNERPLRMEIKPITESLYRTAKLAGEPTDD